MERGDQNMDAIVGRFSRLDVNDGGNTSLGAYGHNTPLTVQALGTQNAPPLRNVTVSRHDTRLSDAALAASNGHISTGTAATANGDPTYEALLPGVGANRQILSTGAASGGFTNRQSFGSRAVFNGRHSGPRPPIQNQTLLPGTAIQLPGPYTTVTLQREPNPAVTIGGFITGGAGASIVTEPINITYARNGSNASVKRFDLKLLLTDMTKEIVVFGEGNFTFTVALVAIRGSWSGIIATRYEQESARLPRLQFHKVQQECKEFCNKNGWKLSKYTPDRESIRAIIRSYIEAIERVPPPMGSCCYGIDATNTPDWLALQGKVVLFQCPWKPKRDPVDTSKLIADFLQHMSAKQNEGDYALVGINKHRSYVANYKLHELLGPKLSKGTDKSGRYNFLGADDAFIEEILKHGYHHQSCYGENKDIHDDIIHYHITLVFQRNAVLIF